MVQRKGCRKGTYGLHTNKRVLRNKKNRIDFQNNLYQDCDDDWDQLITEISKYYQKQYIFKQQSK